MTTEVKSQGHGLGIDELSMLLGGGNVHPSLTTHGTLKTISELEKGADQDDQEMYQRLRNSETRYMKSAIKLLDTNHRLRSIFGHSVQGAMALIPYIQKASAFNNTMKVLNHSTVTVDPLLLGQAEPAGGLRVRRERDAEAPLVIDTTGGATSSGTTLRG